LNYNIEDREKEKMHSLDRAITLKPMEGKPTLNSSGAVDKRLFNGENRLRAVYDNVHGLWGLKYDKGAVPGGLEGRFTDLQVLIDYVRSYYARRNVEVSEVGD